VVKLKPGDKITCRVKDSLIVSGYAEFDEERTFEIIAADEYGYFVYVPEYVYIKNVTRITQYNIKALDINKKFIECFCIYVHESSISKVHSILDGMTCCKCNEFYNQAEANQEDGSMICWNCRNYRFYK
jgi:hypothetical protein